MDPESSDKFTTSLIVKNQRLPNDAFTAQEVGDIRILKNSVPGIHEYYSTLARTEDDFAGREQ
jgi:hypothetical protein